MKITYIVDGEKKIGFFAWEDNRWEVYSTVDKQLDKGLQDIEEIYDGGNDGGVFYDKVKVFTRKDRDYINHVFETLLYNFKEPYSISNIKTITPKQLETLKEIFS